MAAPSGVFDFPASCLPVRLAGRRCREETGLRETGGAGEHAEAEPNSHKRVGAGKAARRLAGGRLWPTFPRALGNGRRVMSCLDKNGLQCPYCNPLVLRTRGSKQAWRSNKEALQQNYGGLNLGT